MTSISFTIPRNSGDALDKPLVPGVSYKIIVAYGPNGADEFGSYHGSRGSFETELQVQERTFIYARKTA